MSQYGFLPEIAPGFYVSCRGAPPVMQKWAAFLPLLRTEEGTSLPPSTSRARSPSQRRTAPLAARQLLCSTPRAAVPKASPRARACPAQGTCPWCSPCRLSAGAGLAQALQQMPPMGLLLVPGQLLGALGAGSLRLHPTPNLSPFRGRGKQGSGSGQGLGKAPLWDPSGHSRRQPPQPAGARQGSQGTGSPPPPPTLGAATRCQHLLGVLEVSLALRPRAVQVHPWTPSCSAAARGAPVSFPQHRAVKIVQNLAA